MTENFTDRRDRMVDHLVEQGRIERASTAAALRAVPRHEFVPEERRRHAYDDRPLPIGEDQTISAPHMVGIMLDLLALDPGDRVLEIGTGCGYHAAATAEVVGTENVYSVEYHESLAERARARLTALGYGDISIRVGDGHAGWPAHAPYDAAYLTCAARAIPERVLDQVRDDGGRLLGPIGSRWQTLVLLRKRSDGSIDREDHGGVRFVPMRGGE
ncbi:protein-L-isoaspartate(D-aspartate) O-methyltransferase [Halovivax sp.]|uniref:protein-L-isoaspartate(D-aspartate) O-methyltransferase n=1 Tax=Halovivax sp. TaxID=1935978 RepID=UPI0025C3A107|nr:protein-L-isoaspartate(D-aspartate) O-methyltransferase [Halovivax sp.]